MSMLKLLVYVAIVLLVILVVSAGRLGRASFTSGWFVLNILAMFLCPPRIPIPSPPTSTITLSPESMFDGHASVFHAPHSVD
jgi:hypothetical protein